MVMYGQQKKQIQAIPVRNPCFVKIKMVSKKFSSVRMDY